MTQKNGVSFVSPVTKSDTNFKQRAYFVPRVSNRKLRAKRHDNFRIKRGSNVPRAVTPPVASAREQAAMGQVLNQRREPLSPRGTVAPQGQLRHIQIDARLNPDGSVAPAGSQTLSQGPQRESRKQTSQFISTRVTSEANLAAHRVPHNWPQTIAAIARPMQRSQPQQELSAATDFDNVRQVVREQLAQEQAMQQQQRMDDAQTL